MKIETRAVHAGRTPEGGSRDVVPAIHLSTTFHKADDGSLPGGYLYGRPNNPNRESLEHALASLEKLTRAPRPHPGAKVPEIEEVLADTYARLAELRLRGGGFDAAAHDVQEGLAHASDATYFRGHLFEVAGLVEEARAGSLADAGHASDADRARERALALLQEAVDIQNKVIADSLADAGP